MKQFVFITLCAGFAASGAFFYLEAGRSTLAPPSTPDPVPCPTHRNQPELTDAAAHHAAATPASPPLSPSTRPSQTVTSQSYPLVPITTPPQPGNQPPRISGQGVTRAQLERRAQRVEQEANRELQRLLPLLDLSPSEQDRIFAILAVTSPGYDPAMSVGGSRSAIAEIRKAIESGADREKTRLDKIYEAVDEQDQIEIVDTYLEKEEWWINIVADLEAELEAPPLSGQLDEPVLLTSPGDGEAPADDEISVTRPTVFPSE